MKDKQNTKKHDNLFTPPSIPPSIPLPSNPPSLSVPLSLLSP